MKMHLKCNNKNDNGIIILHIQKKNPERMLSNNGVVRGGSRAHFMPIHEANARKYATLLAAR